jgi:hypothetical protein
MSGVVFTENVMFNIYYIIYTIFYFDVQFEKLLLCLDVRFD